VEEPDGVLGRNLLEKLSRSSLGVAARSEACGQKQGTLGRKKPIFESLDSRIEKPGFLFPQQTPEAAVCFHQFSTSPSQDPSGIAPGAAFGAGEVPAVSSFTFSYSAAGTGRGEPQKGTAGLETHRSGPDKMKQGK